MNTNINNLIEDLNYLKLNFLAEHAAEMAGEAAKKRLGHLEFLASVIAAEAGSRRDRAAERRMRQAALPVRKTLDNFNWDHPEKINRDLVRHLFNLQFIEEKKNVAFLGAPGVGKSHLCIALAEHACARGYRVRFTTAIDIINRMDAAQKNGTFAAAMKTYEKPNLLVIDEIGYLPIEQRGADIFFQVISSRYERGSIALTSNRAFKDWSKIFNNDAVITSAILERVCHHCEPVIIEGKSYRMKDRRKDV